MSVDEKTFQSYMKDPADHFESPLAVAFNSELSAEQKQAILESWKLDEKELQVAADENMSSENADRLARVQDALSHLQSTDDQKTTH